MVGWLTAAVTAVAVQRLAELVLACRNRRWLLARGAREHGAGHYPLFVALHAGWLAGWLAEALMRGGGPSVLWPLWTALFLTAQILRYWCIVSLGHRWNTRILVLPGIPPVRRGPYRYLRHPNYLAVTVELLCGPLIFGAWLTALAAGLMNAWLLLAVRIPAEEKALAELTE
ncbi:isoprenylcysteine carboxyl methyltransferase family protein [Anaeroselena agilis]|uniref:Isoprenylcysteine carboxylmethyltransferase family protein n=1 Tax=Anaeroselena agilis TaxID=3063788 RepID=A0ABU3P4J0_9FIRM|nr:isoprenylcysteine carboxylmethyltransferase family protein [Selenomonadales bacterium 4137-cl]